MTDRGRKQFDEQEKKCSPNCEYNGGYWKCHAEESPQPPEGCKGSSVDIGSPDGDIQVDWVKCDCGRVIVIDEHYRNPTSPKVQEPSRTTWEDLRLDFEDQLCNFEAGNSSIKYMMKLFDLYVQDARQQERERCAKIISDHVDGGEFCGNECLNELEKEILNPSWRKILIVQASKRI